MSAKHMPYTHAHTLQETFDVFVTCFNFAVRRRRPLTKQSDSESTLAARL